MWGFGLLTSPIKTRHSKKKYEASSNGESQSCSVHDGPGSLRDVKALDRSAK